jgi:hypothetical protein
MDDPLSHQRPRRLLLPFDIDDDLHGSVRELYSQY